jgi:hypothetical protein
VEGGWKPRRAPLHENDASFYQYNIFSTHFFFAYLPLSAGAAPRDDLLVLVKGEPRPLLHQAAVCRQFRHSLSADTVLSSRGR